MDVIENGGTAEDAASALCQEAVDRAVLGPGERGFSIGKVTLV